MHYVLKGLLFYVGIVVLRIGIFGVVLGTIALVEFLYKKYKNRRRERLQQERANFLRENTVKTTVADLKPCEEDLLLNCKTPTNNVLMDPLILDDQNYVGGEFVHEDVVVDF